MNHRWLLRIALFLWAAPLAVASFVMLGFVFMRAPLFAATGLVVLVAGGACLVLGVLVVLVILSTHHNVAESPRRYYKKHALRVLGLLLLNLPIAVGYSLLGWSLQESSALDVVASPDGEYLAEVVLLGEDGQPPYGEAVTLRPQPRGLWRSDRTVVFSAHCLGTPRPEWTTARNLSITCIGAEQTGRRLPLYRDVKIRYALPPAPVVERPRKRSK